MTEPLWQLGRAGCGRRRAAADGAPEHAITGFSIDTRTLAPGDVFVALKDQRDGHDFVVERLQGRRGGGAGVAKAIARQAGDGALLRVADPLRALEAIGRAARDRARNARIVAVTGSVGKTGTKEMLRLCLSDARATRTPRRSPTTTIGACR